MTNSDHITKACDEFRDKILEHVDSVRILVTFHDGNKAITSTYDTGGGNFFAQLGQVHEWLCIQEQYQRNHAIKKDQEE